MDSIRRSQCIVRGYWRTKIQPTLQCIIVEALVEIIAKYAYIVDFFMISAVSKDYIEAIECKHTIKWNVPHIGKFPNTYPSHAIIYNSFLFTPTKHKIKFEMCFTANIRSDGNIFIGFTDNYGITTIPQMARNWSRKSNYAGFEIYPRLYYSKNKTNSNNRYFIRELSVQNGTVIKGRWNNHQLMDRGNQDMDVKALQYRFKKSEGRFEDLNKIKGKDYMNLDESIGGIEDNPVNKLGDDYDPIAHHRHYGPGCYQVYGSILLSIHKDGDHYENRINISEFPNGYNHHSYFYKLRSNKNKNKKNELKDIQLVLIIPHGSVFNLRHVDIGSANWVTAVSEKDL